MLGTVNLMKIHVKEVTDSRIEPAIVMLINGYGVKLPSTYLCLYPENHVGLNLGSEKLHLEMSSG